MITDKLVFIHMPRTGGSTHRGYIKRLSDDGRLKVLGDFGERCARALPQKYQHLPKIGFVRNPWAWYVSRYHWFLNKRFVQNNLNPDGQMTRGLDAGIFNAKTKEDVPSFKSHMMNGFNMDTSLPQWPRKFSGDWPGHPYFSMTGCYFDMYFNQYGKLYLDSIYRLEDKEIHEELYIQRGVDIGEIRFADEFISKRSEHKPYQEYYDEELREKVKKVDTRLIEKFSYKFIEL
ncbi:MAG: hypothetical protein GWN86_26310 [Desulfobacterales bacterium]|nr:hypothetical protein [Desulfobacterales bacterium]